VLLGSADYTATNGTTVVLATGAAVGNLVTIESFQVSSVLNAIPNTAGAVSSSNIQTSPTLTTPTIDKINTSVTNTSLGAGNASIMKNRIINGAMVIDQRNAGASVNADGSYTLDRWRASTGAANKFSVQQNAGSITPPVGFVNYIGLTSTATTTPSGADEYSIEQFIEGYNISDLGFGTANAKTVTLSFWVRSSLTGTFGGVIGNGSNNRSYVYSYTISAANTWEQKSITITGDTSGTWLTTTGRGMRLSFSLGCGSTVTTAAGSWQAGYYVNPTGGVNVVGTNGATFYITGVQLEVGSSATGFEYRMYGTELANCQRYYWQQSGIASTVTTIGSGMVYASNDIRCSVQNPVTMRTTPTIAFTGSAFEYERAGTSRGTLSTLNSTGRSADSSVLYSGSGTTAGTSGDGAIWYLTNSGSNFGVSAEL
jgi:hypothetical protein